jgi:hypothetical protein
LPPDRRIPVGIQPCTAQLSRAPSAPHLRLRFQAIGTIDALVVRRSAAGTAVRFTGMEEGTREQLIPHLYTMGLEQESDVSAGFARRSTTPRLVGAS